MVVAANPPRQLQETTMNPPCAVDTGLGTGMSAGGRGRTCRRLTLAAASPGACARSLYELGGGVTVGTRTAGLRSRGELVWCGACGEGSQTHRSSGPGARVMSLEHGLQILCAQAPDAMCPLPKTRPSHTTAGDFALRRAPRPPQDFRREPQHGWLDIRAIRGHDTCNWTSLPQQTGGPM